MADSLLGFILTRLDQIESPVFLHRELERFPAEQLEMVLSEGILRETAKATEIPRPTDLPAGGYLLVRQTEKGLFGVAAEDDYFDPIPLVEDDVRQYEVLISKVLDCIRRENGLIGVPVANGRKLFLVGERLLPSRSRADIYLSLVNGDPSDFMLVCKKVQPTNPRPVVMLVPRPIPLSVENVQLLRNWGIDIVPLIPDLDGKRWELPWSQILRKPIEGGMAEGTSENIYCRVISKDGTHTLDKSRYQALLKTRNKYDMFIDGMTRETSCRDGKGHSQAAKLTPKELGIVVDVIMAGKPMRPYNTKTGNNCSSSSSACRLFVEARKKVDVKLGRYRYRAFRLHKDSSDSKLNAHEFTPPDGFVYCLILSA